MPTWRWIACGVRGSTRSARHNPSALADASSIHSGRRRSGCPDRAPLRTRRSNRCWTGSSATCARSAACRLRRRRRTCRTLRRFLAQHGQRGIGDLTAAAVSKAVLAEVAGWSPASVRRYAVGLRSFLRYCQLAGLIETDLSASVLPVSGRRRSLLPQGISETQARALLRSCDRRRATGRRDHAVIVLMLRLGLRAGEGRGAAAGGPRLAGRADHGAICAAAGRARPRCGPHPTADLTMGHTEPRHPRQGTDGRGSFLGSSMIAGDGRINSLLTDRRPGPLAPCSGARMSGCGVERGRARRRRRGGGWRWSPDAPRRGRMWTWRWCGEARSHGTRASRDVRCPGR
jgi:hypothetical protein